MFPSSNDHGISADTGCTITVHEFVAVEVVSTSRAALQLERGRDLAFGCSTSNRWVTPQSTTDSSAFALRRDRLYQYRFSPPPLITAIRSINIHEWGQPSHADDPDHFLIQDLQEFESTDFQTSLMHSRIGEVEPSRHGKRSQDSGLNANEPAKRPRLEASSILDLVPQPHFIQAPAAKFQPVDTRKIPHYQKTLPTPIPPYDAAAVNQLLSCRFRRVAWLIPVRGSLPWDGASTAVILEGTQVASRSPSPCLHLPAAQPCAITWTSDSLQHLWTFLGSIQQARHLGPLSLSFHAAPADAFSTRDIMSEPVWESNHPYYLQHSPKHITGSSDDFATDICRTHLECIDYIKVYHDVPYSLSLRNILDAYQYEPVNGEVPGRSGANDRKIRILKGAHLVFVDERSKAAFLIAGSGVSSTPVDDAWILVVTSRAAVRLLHLMWRSEKESRTAMGLATSGYPTFTPDIVHL
ncbi:hypothetical protein J3R83DRAFT_13899 [Lanmaoa asiatica]|nr:hypothetical protein J3R83DRAFT_13899 [Lanmaoa asiatica]